MKIKISQIFLVLVIAFSLFFVSCEKQKTKSYEQLSEENDSKGIFLITVFIIGGFALYVNLRDGRRP